MTVDAVSTEVRRGVEVFIRAGTRAFIHLIGVLDRLGTKLKRRGWGRYVVGRVVIDVILLPADIEKIIRTYKETFGCSPHMLHAVTFNEKLQRAKLSNRPARYIRYADKLEVRTFVRQRVGSDVLTQLYWVGKDLAEARKTALPPRFVVKANQSSGNNLFVRDVETFDWERAIEMTARWLETDHSVHYGEWQYRWISARLLIEEYLDGPDGAVPLDYKFFCFHGKVRLVQVDFERFSRHTRAFVDDEFRPLNLGLKYPVYCGAVVKPPCFREMLGIAECLSRDERFLRVDLYDVGKPVFGELTMCPEAGLGHFDPVYWDLALGEWL